MNSMKRQCDISISNPNNESTINLSNAERTKLAFEILEITRFKDEEDDDRLVELLLQGIDINAVDVDEKSFIHKLYYSEYLDLMPDGFCDDLLHPRNTIEYEEIYGHNKYPDIIEKYPNIIIDKNFLNALLEDAKWYQLLYIRYYCMGKCADALELAALVNNNEYRTELCLKMFEEDKNSEQEKDIMNAVIIALGFKGTPKTKEIEDPLEYCDQCFVNEFENGGITDYFIEEAVVMLLYQGVNVGSVVRMEKSATSFDEKQLILNQSYSKFVEKDYFCKKKKNSSFISIGYNYWQNLECDGDGDDVKSAIGFMYDIHRYCSRIIIYEKFLMELLADWNDDLVVFLNLLDNLGKPSRYRIDITPAVYNEFSEKYDRFCGERDGNTEEEIQQEWEDKLRRMQFKIDQPRKYMLFKYATRNDDLWLPEEISDKVLANNCLQYV